MQKKRLLLIAVAAAALFAAATNARATDYTAIASGNWSSTSTWNGSVVPTFSGNQTIYLSGYTVTVASAITDTSGSLTLSGGALKITAASSFAKGLILSNSTLTLAVTNADNALSTTSSCGPVSIGVGSLLDCTTAKTNHFGYLYMSGGTLASTSYSSFYGSYWFENGISVSGGGTSTMTAQNMVLYAYYNGASSSSAYGSGTTTFTVDSGSTLLVSGTFKAFIGSSGSEYRGTGPMIKTGDGLMVLAGSNSTPSTIYVNAGTLAIGNGCDTGSVVGSIVNNSTLVFNRSNAYSFGSANYQYLNKSNTYTNTQTISGSGSVVMNGSGTLTLSTANTYTGATYVNAGTLALTSTGSIDSSKVYVKNAGNSSDSFSSTHAVFAKTVGTSSTYSVASSINGGLGCGGTISGSNASTTATALLTMSWRERSTDDAKLLISDIVNVTGGASNSATSYSLTMGYSESALAVLGTLTDEQADAKGLIYIAYWDGDSWEKLGGTVDTTNNMVTATVSDTALTATQFAVVPEPGTLAMLAGALLGLIAYAWRKRK